MASRPQTAAANKKPISYPYLKSVRPASALPRTPPLPQTTGATAEGAGLTRAEVGCAARFTIITMDQRNERERGMGGDIVVARLTQHGRVTVQAHVLDNTDGTYACSYVPQSVDANQQLEVTVNGTRVKGSPFKPRIAAGRIVAGQCTASGAALYDGIAGRPIEFTIQARDGFGNACSSGGAGFKMAITGTEPACAEFEETFKKFGAFVDSTDNGDGSYSIVWSVDLPGEYTLNLSLDRIPIRGSPFRVFVASPFVRPPATILHSNIEPAPEAVSALVELPDTLVRPLSATLIDGQLVTASTMLQNANVATRHTSFHTCQFRVQYAHEKQYVRSEKGIPLCRWRGTLVSDYRDDPSSRAAHSLVSDDANVFVISQSHGPLGLMDRLRRAPVHGGGDAKPPSVFTPMRMRGDTPKVVEGFCLLHTPSLPVSADDAGGGDGGAPAAAATGAEGGEEGEEEELFDIPTSAALWVFGGVDATGNTSGEVYRYDLQTERWAELGAEYVVEAPFDIARTHTAVASAPTPEGEPGVWLFGGRTSAGGVQSDLHFLDLYTFGWESPDCAGELCCNREKHSLTYCLDRFLIAAGGLNTDGSAVSDIALLDLHTMTWHQRRISPNLQRLGHVAGYACGSLYLYGGTDASLQPATTIVKLRCSDFPQQSALLFDGTPSKHMVAKASPSLNLAPQFVTKIEGKGKNIQHIETQLPTKFSIDCWVHPSSFVANGPAVVKADGNYKTGWGLVALDDGVAARLAPKDTEPELLPNVAFFVGGFSNKVLMKLPTNEWSHVACTFDGHLLTAYRNGKRADFVTIDIPCEELTIHANADLYVGAYPGRYAWDGLVDVVRLWGRCIEWADVRTAMNNSHVTNDPQLLGQWTCSEGAGTTIFDSSSKGNHATLEGDVQRVQCLRDFVPPIMTASEKHVDSIYLQLREWKMVFEKREKRQPTRADMLMAPPELRNMARRLGLLDSV